MANLVKNIKEVVEIPDEYKPILNSVLAQLCFHHISGKNRNLTAIHILQLTKEFYDNNPNVPPINT